MNLWARKGPEPHHLFIAATVSGSWWCGSFDERGIPHATMNDGAPNGYSILTFDGPKYSIEFKAASRPADYQMNIYLADDVAQPELATTEVLANIFAGSKRSTVEMQISADGPWRPLEYTEVIDPQCLRMHEQSPFLDMEKDGRKLDTIFGWKMDYPSKSRHMWKATLRPTSPPAPTPSPCAPPTSLAKPTTPNGSSACPYPGDHARARRMRQVRKLSRKGAKEVYTSSVNFRTTIRQYFAVLERHFEQSIPNSLRFCHLRLGKGGKKVSPRRRRRFTKGKEIVASRDFGGRSVTPGMHSS